MNLPQVAAHTAGIFQAWMGGIADVPAQTPEELASLRALVRATGTGRVMLLRQVIQQLYQSLGRLILSCGISVP